MRSTAQVTTERAARYIKQLVSHLGHHVPTELADDGTGIVNLPGGQAVLTPLPGALALAVTADDTEALDRTQDVVARHLVRFATGEDLIVTWSTD